MSWMDRESVASAHRRTRKLFRLELHRKHIYQGSAETCIRRNAVLMMLYPTQRPGPASLLRVRCRSTTWPYQSSVSQWIDSHKSTRKAQQQTHGSTLAIESAAARPWDVFLQLGHPVWTVPGLGALMDRCLGCNTEAAEHSPTDMS